MRPRDVDPEAGNLTGVHLWGLAELQLEAEQADQHDDARDAREQDAVTAVRDLVPELSLGGQTSAADYEGSGTGEVMVEIPEGASGGEIGELLVQQDVIASTSAFTAAISADNRGATIQPGTYRMAEQMSSQAALSRLLDGGYREINGVTIREGLWVAETFEILAEQTGHDVAEYEAIDPEDLDLPEAAGGELEGFLYPSTYEFPATAGPQEQLQTMIDQGKAVQARLGLEDEELRVVFKEFPILGEDRVGLRDLRGALDQMTRKSATYLVYDFSPIVPMTVVHDVLKTVARSQVAGVSYASGDGGADHSRSFYRPVIDHASVAGRM